jgi:hypothetical protein
MGHESQIEPWLAHDQRSACWFHKSLASSQIEYENHRGRTHKRYAVVRSVPSLWSGMREQSCSIPRGLKINKNSAEGEVFFVDFPSYRTLQAVRGQNIVLGYLQLTRLFIIYKQLTEEAEKSVWKRRDEIIYVF